MNDRFRHRHKTMNKGKGQWWGKRGGTYRLAPVHHTCSLLETRPPVWTVASVQAD